VTGGKRNDRKNGFRDKRNDNDMQDKPVRKRSSGGDELFRSRVLAHNKEISIKTMAGTTMMQNTLPDKTRTGEMLWTAIRTPT
jgi:hypothetical protein